MFKKLKCKLGFHNNKLESVLVAKGEGFETRNSRFVCKDCGRTTEWVGGTHFKLTGTTQVTHKLRKQ